MHTYIYIQCNRNVRKPLTPHSTMEYFFQKFVGERAITDASVHPINFYNNGISNWGDDRPEFTGADDSSRR